MTAAITPGPWRVAISMSNQPKIYAQGPQAIAQAPNPADREAIAAVPKMIEALMEARLSTNASIRASALEALKLAGIEL